MTTIKLKRGTSTRWQELNPILSDAEQGYEKDTGRFKIGNGVTPWLELPYFESGVGGTSGETSEYLLNRTNHTGTQSVATLSDFATAVDTRADARIESARVVFNAQTFGAVGDGVVNDTPSIQAAIDAATAAGGGTVILLEGTYLSGRLTLKSNVTLHISKGATLVAVASQTFLIQSAVAASNIGVIGEGKINANGNVSSSIVSTQGAVDGFLLSNVTITDTGTALFGLYCPTGASNVVVEGCTFDGVRDSITLHGGITRVRVVNNTIKEWRYRGIRVLATGSAASSNVLIQNNRVVDLAGGTDRYPIVFSSGGGPRHLGVVVKDNLIVGLNTSHTDPANPGTADQIALRWVEQFVVSDNVSIDGGDAGISLDGCWYGTVSNNVIMRADRVGIIVGGPGSGFDTDIAVSGNTVINSGLDRIASGTLPNGGIGISVDLAKRVKLAGNVISDDQVTPTMNYGVQVRDSDDVDWGGNLISGYITGPFVDDGGNTNVGTGFFGALTAQPTLPAAGVVTADNIRQALIDLGLAQ